MMLEERVYGCFGDEASLLSAVRLARERSLPIGDVYAPYPVHGLDEAMGLSRSRLGWVTLAGALAGMLGAIALQVGTAVVDWPLNVGGKPANSALAFLPITFELTVLLAGLSSAGAFLWRSRLHPLAPVRHLAPGVTDDTFVLVLQPTRAHAEGARQFLVEVGATQIRVEGGQA
jgi:ActD protein